MRPELELRLENGVGSSPNNPESRRNEQVARSKAECQQPCVEHDLCHKGTVNTINSGKEAVGSRTPLFLVRNKDNVNAQLWRAKGLITMWDFLVYKRRIGMTNIILQEKLIPLSLKIMPVKCHSRYFNDGRLYISRKIKRRLGKFEKIPGLMETLTYDTKRISKQEAWGGALRED